MKPVTKKIILDEPLARGDQTLTEVTLRRPASGELRGLNLQDVMSLDVAALQKLLPRITTPALTEQDIANLTPADLLEIGSETAAFFIRKEKLAEISQPA